MTIQIDILNPKATRLIKDLEDLNLISIKETPKDGFLRVVNRLRKKAAANSPSITEITREVNIVRGKRYEEKKG